MTCDEARSHLLDLHRGRLAPELRTVVAGHLEGCAACARVLAEEEVLTALLERLPSQHASAGLKRRLAALAASALRVSPGAGRGAPAPSTRSRYALPAAIAAALVAVAAAALLGRAGSRGAGPLAALTSEAVSDHLRVLQRGRPVDVESTGIHDVKPWFEGKLDFAPSVPGPVGPEMRLVGGAMGYFLDRPAAVVVYGLRRHVLTLLVFRADGVAWPGGTADARPRLAAEGTSRGFHVFLWRSGGLGYALVGDADRVELSGIAAMLAGET
jgi:anti-sigma factor RsiW